jgi:hypothetical protein
VRSLAVLTVVTGLIATFALPAYAAWPADLEIPTLQQVASEDAQSLIVASDATGTQLTRESYSATTQAEIDQKKAAEAAAERARASAQVASAPFDYSIVPQGRGAVRWPVGGPFTVTDRFGARGGAHMGTDMVAAGGTPVYASVDGVVRISQDSYGGYGVTVVVESVLNGQQVSTVYPHMQTGSGRSPPGRPSRPGSWSDSSAARDAPPRTICTSRSTSTEPPWTRWPGWKRTRADPCARIYRATPLAGTLTATTKRTTLP